MPCNGPGAAPVAATWTAGPPPRAAAAGAARAGPSAVNVRLACFGSRGRWLWCCNSVRLLGVIISWGVASLGGCRGRW